MTLGYCFDRSALLLISRSATLAAIANLRSTIGIIWKSNGRGEGPIRTIVAGTSLERNWAFMKADRLLLVTGVVGALLAILQCFPLIALPYQIDYGEGLLLDGALRVRHSQPLSPDPYAVPVVLHVYGPVSYAVASLALPDGTASFPAGRRMVLMCSVVLGLLVGAILRRLTGSWWIGLAIGLVLLALPAFRFWLYLLRADVIGVLFSTIGIALYISKEKSGIGVSHFLGSRYFASTLF